MQHTQADVQKIKELTLKLHKVGLSEGLKHGDVTIALGFAAKLLALEAFSSKENQSVSEEKAYEMAKSMLLFGFDQNVQSGPTSSDGPTLEPKKAH